MIFELVGILLAVILLLACCLDALRGRRRRIRRRTTAGNPSSQQAASIPTTTSPMPPMPHIISRPPPAPHPVPLASNSNINTNINRALPRYPPPPPLASLLAASRFVVSGDEVLLTLGSLDEDQAASLMDKLEKGELEPAAASPSPSASAPPASLARRRLTAERCVICTDAFCAGDRATSLPCGHVYHADCIEEWISRRPTCPICRLQLTPELLLHARMTTGHEEDEMVVERGATHPLPSAPPLPPTVPAVSERWAHLQDSSLGETLPFSQRQAYRTMLIRPSAHGLAPPGESNPPPTNASS